MSDHFLREEREKLEQYRESVRTHYSELRSGVRDGLPTDLARPLSVGQRVIAYHPKTREIHDGSILTVDSNRCRVQFDRPDLGVEFVMVIYILYFFYQYVHSSILSEEIAFEGLVLAQFNDAFVESYDITQALDS